MNLQKIPLARINPAPYNPRIDLNPDDLEYQKLKKSIDTFGYVEPIVWNSQTGNLVGGHQRFKILVEHGLKEIEVSVVDLPSEKEKLLNLALNKIQGRWDEIKLAELLENLSALPDLDLPLSGFDLPEISQIIDDHIRPVEEFFDFQATVDSIHEPITKPGDLICLGQHRVMCSDSGNMDDVNKLMGDEKAQLVYMDAPYNVAYDNKARPIKDNNSKKWDSIKFDNLSQAEYQEWLKGVFVNMGHCLDTGATAYVWNGHRQFYFMHQVLTELNYHVSSVITWSKDNFAISFAPYNWQTEHCLFFWKKKNGPHKWYGNGKQSTLWYAGRDNAKCLLHPTQKPVSLAMKALKNSSKRDDLVLDLFAGSGSTLIAAEQLNRKAYLMEISPVYCDAIVRRFISFIGKENISSEIRQRYVKEAHNG